MKRCFITLLLLILLTTLFTGIFVKNISAAGNEGEPCLNGVTCLNNLICTYPETQYSRCQTQEKIDEKNPNYHQKSNVSVYCNGNENDGINTALGCIKLGTGNQLVATILKISLGVGGGIALALILYGVFIITTSAGMPDKLKAGKEIITSAIVGLIFIILSVFLVNLIGINILGIPGLS